MDEIKSRQKIDYKRNKSLSNKQTQSTDKYKIIDQNAINELLSNSPMKEYKP